MAALRKSHAAPAHSEGSVVGSEGSWTDVGAVDEVLSLASPLSSRVFNAIPASEANTSEMLCEEVRAARLPRTLGRSLHSRWPIPPPSRSRHLMDWRTPHASPLAGRGAVAA